MTSYAYRDGVLAVDGVPLQDLAALHGTPLYVYSARAIRDRCRAIEQAFDGQPHTACYAVKANANLAILRLIAREGLGADVGSRGELFLALRAGFPPGSVTFSGVGKQDDEIAYALQQGVHAFAVESREEIEVLSQLAGRTGATARILLRVNLDIDAGGHAYISTSRKENKFGIPAQLAGEVLRAASALPHIEARGIHSHIGSQITRLEVFLTAARAIARLVRDLRASGVPVHDLDFGGGYGVQYHGTVQHPELPAEEAEPADLPAADMVRAVLPVLRETGCALSVQPGRSIVAEAGALVVRVLYRKVSEAKTFIVVDGGMNDLLRPSLYHAHHQIVPLALTGAPHEVVDVVGPVCESGDFFAQDRPLPRVQRGDHLAILCAGAYGFVLGSNYNARLRPAEVLVDGGGASAVRARERVEDLLARQV